MDHSEMPPQNPAKTRARGIIYVIASAVLFGMMPLMTKTIFAHGGNAYTAAFFRFLIGAVLLGLIVKVGRHERLLIGKKELLSALGLSVFYALMLGLLYSSYAYISSGLATTLHFTYPAAVILLQLALFRVRPTKRELLCLILALGGIFLMNFRGGRTSLAGILLAVFSGVAYAFYIALYGRSRVKDLSALLLSFWISVFAAAELALFITLTGNWQLPTDMAGWGMMTLLALLTDVLALVFFQEGLKACGGVMASLLSTFEPLTGLAIGVLVYREALTLASVAAVVCILGSVLLLLVKSNERG
jgi:drug/metabolite transporter (DMT)-like permease